jgi:prophage maintenance system killer protein
MHYLDQYDVLAVAARVLRCDSETAVRRTNLDTVAEVLADVRRTAGLAEASAGLLAGLVRERPFEGPNRVIAVAVVLQFAALNHVDVRLEPVEEVDDLLDRVSAGEVATAEVAGFIRTRLEPEHFDWRGRDMFERFSDRARRVVVLAQEEARELNHDFIGTEHLLLGLIHEGEGAAAKVLGGMRISLPAVRDLVVEIIGRGVGRSSGEIPFTPRAKASLERAHQECRKHGDDLIDTEHLLLGLLRDREGVAAQILTKLGGELEEIRRKVHDWMDHRQRVESAVAGFLTDEAASAWTTFGRRHHLLAELTAVLDENERLHEQVAHLRELLRRHHIDPDS